MFTFLSIFVLVYIKELRTTVHGKILLCLLPNMLITFFLFSSSFDEWIDMTNSFREIITMFAFYSSLLWLNILTFDSWWSIRWISQKNLASLLVTLKQSIFRNFEDPRASEKLFKYYCGYCLGFALSTTLLLLHGNRFVMYILKINVLFYTMLCMQMTVVVEVILIVLTVRKIIELKKIENSAENFQFLREIERWMKIWR